NGPAVRVGHALPNLERVRQAAVGRHRHREGETWNETQRLPPAGYGEEGVVREAVRLKRRQVLLPPRVERERPDMQQHQRPATVRAERARADPDAAARGSEGRRAA